MSLSEKAKTTEQIYSDPHFVGGRGSDGKGTPCFLNILWVPLETAQQLEDKVKEYGEALSLRIKLLNEAEAKIAKANKRLTECCNECGENSWTKDGCQNDCVINDIQTILANERLRGCLAGENTK